MQRNTGGAALAGVCVLVAENEFLIAEAIERALAACGCAVLGPVRSAAQALVRIDAGAPDVAVLDVKLDQGTAAPVAEVLRARGVPFVVVTGYPEPLEPTLRNAPRLEKPFRTAELVRAVARAARTRGRVPARHPQRPQPR